MIVEMKNMMISIISTILKSNIFFEWRLQIVIILNNKSQFLSDEFAKWLGKFRIKVESAPPKHQQSNGI